MSPSPTSRCVVLVIDMLNYFANEGDVVYQSRFWDVADAIVSLRKLADLVDSPIIYVNTEFESIEHFQASPMARKAELHLVKGSEEAAVIRKLTPRPTDRMVSKTVNSGFYGTALENTLLKLGTRRVLLAGVHTHVCIALTAADAFYRNYDVVVVADCVTTIDLDRHTCGLDYINRHLGRIGWLSDGLELFE